MRIFFRRSSNCGEIKFSVALRAMENKMWAESIEAQETML